MLGRGELVKATSIYACRPPEVRELPSVSAFINGNIKEIVDLGADLVIGFSDIQKNLARDLIGEGMDVLITNQRSVEEIFSWIYRLALLVDAKIEGLDLLTRLEKKIKNAQTISASFKSTPRVYFEEWDEPQITAIQWVSEVIEICGGDNLFKDKSHSMAKDRIVTSEDVLKRNPDYIFACWCGKKVNLESFYRRKGWEKINAIKEKKVFELPPEIFLQPGPAPIIDGIDILLDHFVNY